MKMEAAGCVIQFHEDLECVAMEHSGWLRMTAHNIVTDFPDLTLDWASIDSQIFECFLVHAHSFPFR